MMPWLESPAVAIDLPGRGSRPGDLAAITLDDFAASAVADIDATGWDRVLLVGHSLAGLTLPRVAERRPDVLAGLVFLSCTVPEPGRTCGEVLETEVESDIQGRDEQEVPASSPEEGFARRWFANDLDEERIAWMVARMGPDAHRVITEPCDLTGLRHPIPRVWIRLLRDLIVPPARQDDFIETIGGAEVLDLDAGHMAMISQPQVLAAMLDDLADRFDAA
jgi:pimeloyl-ACP methyl ester carboxylesterase